MKTTTTNTPTLTLSQQAKQLDAIAENALVMEQGGSFENAFAVADAMNQLRESITPDMMKRFMALQNTSLGFRTDKDPTQKNKQGEFNTPYPEAVVKEVVIEAVLRGVQPIANQINIIAGRLYITKEGFEAKIRKLKELTNFRPIIGIPKNLAGGSIVPCTATWTYKGQNGELSVEIPVRVNEGMGADAIIGKAQRKFLKRVFEQVTGCSSLPDGDIEDVPLQRQVAGPSGLPPDSAATVPDLFPAGQGNPPQTKQAVVGDTSTKEALITRIRKLLNDAKIAESDLINDVIDKHGINAESLDDLHPVTLEEILATFGAVLNRLNKKK